MGLLNRLGLKPTQQDQADQAKADALKSQFGRDFKSAVVLATKLRNPKAKAELARQLKDADSDKRKAERLRNSGERAQAMQAALDKVNTSAAKAQETDAAPPPKTRNTQDGGAPQPPAAKPKAAETAPQPATASKDGASSKTDPRNQTVTTVKRTMDDGVLKTEVEQDKTTAGDGSLTKTHTKDTETLGPGGVFEGHQRESATVDKDGVATENEADAMLIDASGVRKMKNKTSVKAGKGGVTTSNTREVSGPDGTTDSLTKETEVTSEDGKAMVVNRRVRKRVDKAGNSATIKTTKTMVTDKDGNVSTNTSVAVETQTAEQAALEKQRREEEQKQREAQAKALQAQMAAAKNKAVGRGNRLYKLFQADKRPAAGQAHNRGMAKLASGDALARQVTPEANQSLGFAAIADYDAAAQCFAEGMAMFGEGVRPPPLAPPAVPESGGF
jgi:hypothetical protein